MRRTRQVIRSRTPTMIAESNKGHPQEGILTSIRAALEKDTRINLHRYPISLSFQDGDLVVEGEAENIMAKKLALEIAGGVHGSHPIVDRLRVTPAEPMGDAEIRDHVLKVLLQESAFGRCFLYSRVSDGLETLHRDVPEAAGSIVVEVTDGVVTLNGEVPSLSHKRLAGALAWWVPGCRDVVNGLEEVPPEEDNDDELTDAVRLVLEKNPFVNATKIRVRSKDWIITLEGLVPNETMKRMAERDAWCVLGVKRVVNKIAVQW